MKIWHGYGSEHSANLVMIGHFKDVGEAQKALKVIELLKDGVQHGVDSGEIVVGDYLSRYSDAIMDLFARGEVHSIGPAELEQFVYDVGVKREGKDVVITTDEIDVSAFLKVMINKGARVEVRSRHDYPEEEEGRGD